MSTVGKIIVLGGALLCTICLAIFYRHRGPAVQPFSRPTFDRLISPHGGTVQGLKVCGETFRHVKGVPPFYLSISNTHYILFAYSLSEDESVLVLFDTNKCSFRAFPLKGIAFGGRIGHIKSSTICDEAEMISPDKIALTSRSIGFLEKSTLDLTTGKISIEEVVSKARPMKFFIETNVIGTVTNSGR